MTSSELGQCGWIYWIEEGGDGSACPAPATQLRRVPPEGGLMPVQGVYCDEHADAGEQRLLLQHRAASDAGEGHEMLTSDSDY